MFAYFPGTTSQLQAGYQYQVSLHSTRSNLAFSLLITLPQGFPSVAPEINVVQPAMSHAWIDGNGSTMRVWGHPALRQWNGTVQLGKVLKDVELEFSLRSPTILSPNNHGQSQNQSQTQAQAQSSGQSRVNHQTQNQSPGLDAGVAFPEVDLKSLAELKALLDDESAFEAFFACTKACIKSKKAFKELESQNIDLASTLI